MATKSGKFGFAVGDTNPTTPSATTEIDIFVKTSNAAAPTVSNSTAYMIDSAGNVATLVNGVTSVSNSDATLTISPTTGAVVASRAAITGDVSVPSASNIATIANSAVTLAKQANLPAYTVEANITGSSAAPQAAQSLILGTPGFTASGVAEQITGTNAGFFQGIIQNSNSGAGASADFVLENDLGTDTVHYVDIGINSSNFTGTGSLNLANAGYVYTATGDLVLGTLNANAVRFLANNASTDALQINTSNQVVTPGLTGYLKGAGASAVTASTTIPTTDVVNLSGTNSGDVTLTAVGASPNANAASLSGQALTIQPASASFPGVITSAQFTKLANTSGTNSGDVTLSAVGSSPNANGATLTGQVLNLQPAGGTAAGGSATSTNPGVLSTGSQVIPGSKTFTNKMIATDIEGAVYVDPSNSQGWSGSDAGAWINSAFSYISSTYTNTNGGIIQLAPGSYSYSTPIVLANAGLMTIIMRGAGDGNGSTILNYTATSGLALSVGGGSGNDGGVQLEDFTITGTAQGNGATAVQFGVTGVANVAGATCKNISIRRFTNGFTHLNGNSYAIEFINCKVQQTTNGYTPQGEDNIFFGGLLGGNTNGIIGSNAGEVNMFGTAFDDNTTTAINSSNSLFRSTLAGCRFENAGLGTSNYITISNGSIAMQGGALQEDNTTGSATGFVQATGGAINLTGVWLYSGGRTLTQVINATSPAVVTVNNPIIAPGSSGNAISTLFNAAYQGRITAGTATSGTGKTQIVSHPIGVSQAFVGSTYRIEGQGTQSSTAGTATVDIHVGTANTTADAIVATATVPMASNGGLALKGLVTIRSLGGSGTAFGSVIGFGTSTVLSTTTTTTTVNTTAANFVTLSIAASAGTTTMQTALIVAEQPT